MMISASHEEVVELAVFAMIYQAEHLDKKDSERGASLWTRRRLLCSDCGGDANRRQKATDSDI